MRTKEYEKQKADQVKASGLTIRAKEFNPRALESAMNQQSKKETAQYLTPRSVLKGKWQVIEKIGNGGFGEIYKVKDIETKQVSIRDQKY